MHKTKYDMSECVYFQWFHDNLAFRTHASARISLHFKGFYVSVI